MSMTPARSNGLTLNIAAISFLSLLYSAQLLAAMSMAFSMLPLPTADVSVFPEWRSMVRPEREGQMYVIWIASALLAQLGWVAAFGSSMRERLVRLRPYLTVETILTALIGCAWFKIVVYEPRDQLARMAAGALIVMAVGMKIFWPDICRRVPLLYARLTSIVDVRLLNRWAYAAFAVVLVFLIYLPDPEGVVARIFIGEQFHHWDAFVVSAGWAHVNGQILNVDVMSGYALGMPVIMARLTQLFGGFNHLNILLVLNAWAIIYFVLWYFFLRTWTKSVAVAILAILVAVRVQMFHTGEYPITFTYPSATPIRFMFDIAAIWMVWGHIRTHQRRYLIIASVIAGAALYHMVSTGLYLLLALWAYVLFHLLFAHLRPYIVRHGKDAGILLVVGLLPPVVAFALLWTTHGAYLWSDVFRENNFQFVQYFLSGWGVVPIHSSLKGKNFLQSLMGFLMPLHYVFSLIVVGSRLAAKKMEYESVFIVFLCVYGLGLYHYYIALSYWTSYYMVGLPGVFLAVYWVGRYLRNHVAEASRRKMHLILIAAAAFALLTNHNYLSYPNVFNLSPNPLVDPKVAQPLPNGKPYFMHLFYEYPDAFKLPVNSLGKRDEGWMFEQSFSSDEELKAYYRKAFDFSEDAALIARWTTREEPVALISSFETRILMQADRKAFFYSAPLINSRPMEARMWTESHLVAAPQLERTIARLENRKPEYVFVETIFLTRPVPDAYYYDYPGLMPLVDHVLANYTPHARGKFLTAMKRKP